MATVCLIAPREDAYKNHARYKAALIDSADALTRKLTGSAAVKDAPAKPGRLPAKAVG